MDDLVIRPAVPTDQAALLDLLSASLGWGDDERLRHLYDWKHAQNPFGASPALVACDGDRIVGLRAFLRWEFIDQDGRLRRAVRAVDTATDPGYQGRGIFRTLTLRAVEDLTEDGVAFVFNTPNAKSRPGYLTMGWIEVGTLATSIRIGSLGAALRMMRSRVPAERWGLETTVGHPAASLLADPGITALLGTTGHEPRLHTNRTPEYLRWRYGFEPLGYRAVTAPAGIEAGIAIFRLRQRGRSVECALCDLLVPDDDPRVSRAMIREIATMSRADYLIRIGGPHRAGAGFLRFPGQGPMLTWRPLADPTVRGSLTDWGFSLGDIELF